MTTVDKLTSEREALARCEAVIDRGLESFIEVGLALQEIREHKLWRRSGNFASFEAYCRDRWKMSSAQANRNIMAAKTTKMISPAADAATKVTPIGVTPTNESQTRPLAKLANDPPALRQAWQQAVEDAGGEQPTAKQVQEAVRQHQDAKPQPPAPDVEHRRRADRTSRANNQITEASAIVRQVLRQVQTDQIDRTILGPARSVLDIAQQLVAALESTEPSDGDGL